MHSRIYSQVNIQVVPRHHKKCCVLIHDAFAAQVLVVGLLQILCIILAGFCFFKMCLLMLLLYLKGTLHQLYA